MLRSRSLLLLAVLTAHTANAAFGHAKVAEHFSTAIQKHFVKSSRVSYAKRRARKQGKPLLVLLTRSGCGACQNLKQSVNNGREFSGLLDKFVVVHARDKEQAQWQRPGHGYAPQTYFYAPGEDEPLPILGSSDKSPHFLHDEATLVWGMRKTLEVVRTGERSNRQGAEGQEQERAAGGRGAGGAAGAAAAAAAQAKGEL